MMRTIRKSIPRGDSPPTVSVCGSYNKHLHAMRKTIAECRDLGIKVRIPKHAVKKFSTHRFVYLRGENGTPKELQDKNFRAIEVSSFVLVVNPHGYIGTSTAMEIGYAVAMGKPVFCTQRPTDYIFGFYTRSGLSLPEIRRAIRNRRVTKLSRQIRIGA